MKDGNWYAAPSAAVDDYNTGVGMWDQAMLATRSSRLFAAIVDGLTSVVVAIPAIVVIVLMGGDADGMGLYLGMAVAGFFAMILFGINLYLIVQNAQTIGKKVLGIKIIRSDLVTPASPLRIIFLRGGSVWLMSIIPFIGSILSLVDVLMIFGAEQRCLHDMIADTAVIVDQPTSAAPPSHHSAW